MTSTSLTQLIPSPRLFLNSKVNLRRKLLAKLSYALANMLNTLQEVFFYIRVVYLKATKAFLNGYFSPTKFHNGGNVIGSKEGWV